MSNKRLVYMATVLAAISAGCTTMGTGTGSTPSGGDPTQFSWRSTDGVSGTMSATMANGVTYSGRAVANLSQPGGSHMRCQFRLANPEDGMNGGGLGTCQLPDGTTIDANFPKG